MLYHIHLGRLSQVNMGREWEEFDCVAGVHQRDERGFSRLLTNILFTLSGGSPNFQLLSFCADNSF